MYSMSAKFPTEVAALFKRNFDMFDFDNIFRVQTDDIPTLVRVCGAIPLEEKMQEIKALADPDNRGSVDFESFCKALSLAFTYTLKEVDVKKAFYRFDPDKRGLISQHELRFILTTMGDKLTQEEMNEMIEDMRAEVDMEGNFIMVDMLEKMTPEMYKQ